ncbi:YqzE family protein [Cohnella phaseoli]|uniref:YqzE-like protein n=1 Tax=Cohnella phaseoli TaxID=456490 RepID=A0A3D9KRY4_9BACL|nr:YqzE family protein [Cohnella phaseoli]RED89154.1 YqzE-like protein [Cohnella phaseoli]
MDGSEYLKYMTERVVSYMERPKEKEQPRAARSKELWLTKWFGMAPMGLMIWWGGRAERKNKTRHKARSADSSVN